MPDVPAPIVVLDANAAIAALRKHVVASSAFSGAIIRAVDARTKQTSCAADENDVARAHEKENKRRAPGAGNSWRQESRGCGGKWIIRWRSNGALLHGECLFYLVWPCAQCHSAASDLCMSLGEASAAPWHVCAGFPGPWARARETAHQRTEASDSEPLGRVWNCTPVTRSQSPPQPPSQAATLGVQARSRIPHSALLRQLWLAGPQ